MRSNVNRFVALHTQVFSSNKVSTSKIRARRGSCFLRMTREAYSVSCNAFTDVTR